MADQRAQFERQWAELQSDENYQSLNKWLMSTTHEDVTPPWDDEDGDINAHD